MLCSIFRSFNPSIGLPPFAGGFAPCVAVGAAAAAGAGFKGILPFGAVDVPTAIGAEDEGFWYRGSLNAAGMGARDVVTIGPVSFDEAATWESENC